MKYTTKLGNTYDLARYIDVDMPYADYQELVDAGANIAGTMDGRCGIDFCVEPTEIITVALCLNPENKQKTVYCYIPQDETADYELELQNQYSDQYCDYSDTLADKLKKTKNKKEIEKIKKEIKELEKKCTRNSRA